MKRIVGLSIVVLIVAGAIVLFLPKGGVSAANAATISVLNGDVTAQHGSAPFGPAIDGDIMSTGDVVRADRAGRAVLAFFDGSTLSIEPGSEVKVVSLARVGGDGIQVTIEQTLGRTWASVSKLKTPDSKFELKTPTSTAVVRGTTFETLVEVVNGQTVTTIKTDEGEVLVQAVAGGQTTVGAGQQVQNQQNQPAPNSPTPQPPTPRIRFGAATGTGITVIDPNNRKCGGELRQIPHCDTTGGGASIGEVVGGSYTVMMTAAQAVPDAQLTAVGTRGATQDFSITLPRALGIGDLIRTTTTVAIASDGKLSAGAFAPPVQISSVCGAEATGRVFSSGTLDERSSALKAFAASNKGQPAAIVVTESEVSKVAQDGVKSLNGPAAISDVNVKIDGAGLHLGAKAAAGPITVDANGDVIAGTSNGQLLMKVRGLDLGPLPGAIKDQLVAALDKQLGEFAQSFPLKVDRVALRTGCLAIIGTAK
ncbi:MAG: FecR domain-containing protein [Chloroflexi bacterium]|nr:FecR domain-containing protein [Chloroflexota bacterium]